MQSIGASRSIDDSDRAGCAGDYCASQARRGRGRTNHRQRGGNDANVVFRAFHVSCFHPAVPPCGPTRGTF